MITFLDVCLYLFRVVFTIHLCLWCLGSRNSQAIPDSRVTVQEIIGCVDEDAQLLSTVLCSLHQTKWVQEATRKLCHISMLLYHAGIHPCLIVAYTLVSWGCTALIVPHETCSISEHLSHSVIHHYLIAAYSLVLSWHTLLSHGGIFSSLLVAYTLVSWGHIF